MSDSTLLVSIISSAGVLMYRRYLDRACLSVTLSREVIGHPMLTMTGPGR